MTTLFISDLHLDAERPGITALFESFLADQVPGADALYILGDLFETWIGDDDDAPLPARVARALGKLSASGTPVFFIAGNRDFLLGETYAERAGMTLLDDGSTIDLHGTPTLLMHGDLLCTDDVKYQAFRREVHSDAWQREFLSQSLDERRAFAGRAREASREHTGSAPETIMDVNAEAVNAAMQDAGVQRLIHGHTHRPAIHNLQLAGQSAQRIVLGDWYSQGSVLEVGRDAVDLRVLPTG